MNTAKAIIALATAQHLRLATAESCTGGMISAALTDVAGSSAAFEFGFVTYSNQAKQMLLNVQEDTLAAHGAVSEPVVAEMAIGAIKAAKAHISVAVSGIAGPGGSDHKPEGRVCFGLAFGETIRTTTVDFGALGRAEVRQAATDHALDLILSHLQNA